MSEYRINVRFNPENPEDMEIMAYLNSLDKTVAPSRNQFIISAIKAYISGLEAKQKDTHLLDNIREIIREELQSVSLSVPTVSFQPVDTELSEAEQLENDESVLADLELFG